MDALGKALGGRRVKKGEPFTHVTKEIPEFHQGSYYIDKNYESTFLTLICNAVRKGCRIAVAERPGAYTPLRVDFDFYAAKEEGLNRQYDEEDLKLLVKFYQDEIKNIVDPGEFKDEMLTCIVLEKESPRLENSGNVYVSKDGFHFHFPNFICDSKISDYYLRTVVTKKMVDSGIFSKTKISTEINKIIDTNVSTKEWMMYGSMNYKNDNSTPYMYNRKQCGINGIVVEKDPWADVEEEWGHVYDCNLEEMFMADVFSDAMACRPNSVRYYLPELMSIRNHLEDTLVKPEFHLKSYSLAPKLMNTRSRVNKAVNKNRSDQEIYEDLKTISDNHLMDMLSMDRADRYENWMDVGWTLFNITCGKEEGLKLWIDFSQKSSRFENGKCEELWNTMEVRDKTIGSLFRMAKEDSPEEFRLYKKFNTNSWIYKSVLAKKCNEYDIAMVVVAEVGDMFKCVDPKKDIWFVFRDHRWRKSPDAVALKCKIVDVILELYYEFKFEQAERGRTGCSAEEREKGDLFEKRAIEIIDSLKRDSFHRKVVNMCKLRLTDETFMKKANENRMLVCCENGVLDLENRLFREGRPDDYCTMSTGRHFKEFDPKGPENADLDDYLEKVFTNPNIRGYWLDMITSCLQGGNVHKRIFICTGGANGAKSVTMKLVELAFGELMGKLPREVFLRGRGVAPNASRPELVRMIGKRIVSTQEITHMDNFDIGPLKELSGNDTMSLRGHYKDGDDVKFQFSIILQCNKPPKVPGSDLPTWSRIRLVDFESKFVIESDLHLHPVPATREAQIEAKTFHADPDFENNLDYLADVLLWKVYKNFPIFKDKGLKEPKEVILSTNNYQCENDIYQQFTNSKFEKIEDEEEASKKFILLSEIYSEFKAWYQETYPSYAKKEMESKIVVRAEIINKLGIIKHEDDVYGYGDKGSKKSRLWGYKMLYEEGVNKNA
jgi:phage/plasmid-associated DNA primase